LRASPFYGCGVSGAKAVSMADAVSKFLCLTAFMVSGFYVSRFSGCAVSVGAQNFASVQSAVSLSAF
jgi:hypothetical protein